MRHRRTSQNATSRALVNKGNKEGRGTTPRPSTTLAYYYYYFFFTVKTHRFCCKPALAVFWSRGLPAASFAPLVTTALYVAPLRRELVGLRVALSVAAE